MVNSFRAQFLSCLGEWSCYKGVFSTSSNSSQKLLLSHCTRTMKAAFQFILLLTAMTIVSAAPKNVENLPSQGKDSVLKILSLSQEELLALYRTGPDEGIVLASGVTEQSHDITISTLSGLQLVSVRFSSNTGASVWNVMGHTLLLLKSSSGDGKSGVTEYAVPPGTPSLLVEEMVHNPISSKLLSILDTAGTAEIKRLAFSALFSRPEMDTIVKMAQALGEAGIMGHKNQPALNFYGLALQYANMRADLQGRPEHSTAPPPQRPKREEGGTLTCTKPGWFSLDYETDCIRCPVGDDCSGLCGPMCSCWSYVCGDCCYHQGCYDHDMCCSGGLEYLNSECFFFLPFNCTHYKYQCDAPAAIF